jgi:hypothetical protein
MNIFVDCETKEGTECPSNITFDAWGRIRINGELDKEGEEFASQYLIPPRKVTK